MGNDRDNQKSTGVSTLASMVCLGLGAVAGWWLATKVEEERQKEEPEKSKFKPKPCKFETTCALCLEDFSDLEKNIILGCTHTFHEKCFKKLEKKECPICRSRW